MSFVFGESAVTDLCREQRLASMASAMSNGQFQAVPLTLSQSYVDCLPYTGGLLYDFLKRYLGMKLKN